MSDSDMKSVFNRTLLQYVEGDHKEMNKNLKGIPEERKERICMIGITMATDINKPVCNNVEKNQSS